MLIVFQLILNIGRLDDGKAVYSQHMKKLRPFLHLDELTLLLHDGILCRFVVLRCDHNILSKNLDAGPIGTLCARQLLGLLAASSFAPGVSIRANSFQNSPSLFIYFRT